MRADKRKGNTTFMAGILAILLIMATMAGCSKPAQEQTQAAADAVATAALQKNRTTEEWAVVDARLTDAFNGWAMEGVARGGHIEGAVDFSTAWLTVLKKGKDAIAVADHLKQKARRRCKCMTRYALGSG